MKKTQKTKRHKIFRATFPSRMLAVVLFGVVFFEGMLFGVATAENVWQGAQVLDLSASFAQTKTDLAWAAAPMILVVKGVDSFYKQASLETAILLNDNIVEHSAEMILSINKFYKTASRELAFALDMSDLYITPEANAYTN